MTTYVIQPPSHWLYHLANIFLLISYLSPNLLALRLLLAAGCLCFALWGALVLAISIDTTVYNAFFCLINLAQAGWLVYGMRPVRLGEELEAVWRALFDGKDGLVMSRRDWKTLTDKEVYVRDMEADERFAARQSNQHTAIHTPVDVSSEASCSSSSCGFVAVSRTDQHAAVTSAIRSNGCIPVSS